MPSYNFSVNIENVTPATALAFISARLPASKPQEITVMLRHAGDASDQIFGPELVERAFVVACRQKYGSLPRLVTGIDSGQADDLVVTVR